MECNYACRNETVLLAKNEIKVVTEQYPNYKVLTVENILHKGRKVNIVNRAILFAPVGNQSSFWNKGWKEKKVPKIAIIGFSTSRSAMIEFYERRKSEYNDTFDDTCKKTSFAGSKRLRNNIKRIAIYLELDKIFKNTINIESMFDENQDKIFYTQIIKCCSLAKVDNKYDNSSAIYPALVQQSERNKYLYQSAHRKCVDSFFLKEINFSKPIPLFYFLNQHGIT